MGHEYFFWWYSRHFCIRRHTSPMFLSRGRGLFTTIRPRGWCSGLLYMRIPANRITYSEGFGSLVPKNLTTELMSCRH